MGPSMVGAATGIPILVTPSRLSCHNGAVNKPLIVVVGRELSQADGIRGPGFGAGRRYLESIGRAGGLGIIVAPLADVIDDLESLVQRCDGIVLHGGGDINPHQYGQEPETSTLYGVNDLHDAVEIAVVRAAVDHDVPLLAICRGLQILNVVCGGTLVQDLDHPEHRKSLHPVTLTKDSRAAQAMGTASPQRCQSFHHQAIDIVGTGLVITGRSSDLVIEAVELPAARFVIGVQWHPEDTAAEDPEQQGLFDALVRASRNH